MVRHDACAVCGATLLVDTVTYTDTVAGKDYTVDGVLAQVCPECGVQHFSPETIVAIHESIEERQVTT